MMANMKLQIDIWQNNDGGDDDYDGQLINKHIIKHAQSPDITSKWALTFDFQALNRAEQRSQRLQEALRNIRGNAALLEELLALLTEAQALLATKEKDPIPEDLTVVEALVKEHLVSTDVWNKKWERWIMIMMMMMMMWWW